jgi:hypothetical protein
MGRGTLERVLGADQLDAWLARTAQKQYTRPVLFSPVYDGLRHVVFRIKPSVRAAYRDQEEPVGASRLARSNTLNGVETPTSAEVVRSRASVLMPLIAQRHGAHLPWLPGYRVNMIDGHGIDASARRLKALREGQGGALPGTSLGVYAPAPGLVCAGFPWEDGHAQERARLGLGLATVPADDLGIQDRNFCPCAVLGELDRRGACCLTRQQEGRPVEPVKVLRSVGRMETGHGAEQRVQGGDAQGGAQPFRRLRVKREQATRDGDRVLDSLPHVPLRTASAKRVARWYRKRWTLETAFPHLEASVPAAINPLGYPKAALVGLCLAWVAYNMVAVVIAAWRSVHGPETIDQELSLYDVVTDIAPT